MTNTSHGWHIPGTPGKNEKAMSSRQNCGGPLRCNVCKRESENFQKIAGNMVNRESAELMEQFEFEHYPLDQMILAEGFHALADRIEIGVPDGEHKTRSLMLLLLARDSAIIAMPEE